MEARPMSEALPITYASMATACPRSPAGDGPSRAGSCQPRPRPKATTSRRARKGEAMKRTAIVVVLAVAAAGVARAEQTHPSKETYDRLCASCHGTDGKGDGPAAAALDPKPTDLTMLAKNNGGEFPTLKVAESIQGRTMTK